MILKIYKDGNFSRAVNMNLILAINVQEYFTFMYTPAVSGGAVEFVNKDAVTVGFIKLDHKTEERLVDCESSDKYHRINEIYRDIAEEISNYWDCANGVTLLNIDISDKYEKGYEIS